MKLIPAKDKLLHLIAGIYIFLVALIWLSDLWAIVLTLAISIGKEIIWDLFLKKGHASIADALFTFVGGLSVLVLTHIN